MATLPHFIKQGNFIADGYGLIGKIENVKLPDLKHKTEEWRGGGMPGDIDVEVGFEKLTFPFKIGGVDTRIFKTYGLRVGAVKPFQVLGHAVAEDTEETMGVAAYMRGKLLELELDEIKAGSPGMLSGVVALHYYRLLINEEEMIEYDPINLVHKIGGVDQLAATRANLGL